MITRLDHTALSVANLDRSTAFYRDKLGFQVERVIEPGDDGLLGMITRLPAARARIAHLRYGDQMLELFEYLQPRGQPTSHTQADHGFIHLGFRTNDIRSDFHLLKGMGVEFLSEPVEFRPGVWVIYFRGPDGEICELRQA